MAKPVLLTVDDDPEVLKAVERDLRRQYGQNYRVLSANSGQAALDLLEKLRQRGEAVALFLVDYRMPQMSGIEFLAHAMTVLPDAKRVLLTAYSDTEAAIRAINEIKLDHYLLKPWDPPEQNLYPVLDDLLEDWQGSYRPPFEGLRVLGTRWSPPFVRAARISGAQPGSLPVAGCGGRRPRSGSPPRLGYAGSRGTPIPNGSVCRRQPLWPIHRTPR